MKLIALFFPAFISISIYSRRQSVKLVPNLYLFIRYGIYTMLVNWCDMSLTTYILGKDDSKLAYMENWTFFTKYLFIAVIFSLLIPYIEEAIKKYVNIRFRIEVRKQEDGK